MAESTFELVAWHHHWANEPMFIVAELDAKRWELRKLEIFGSGASYKVTTTEPENGPTALAEQPWPTLKEIELDPDGMFSGMNLNHDTFDALWEKPDLHQVQSLMQRPTL